MRPKPVREPREGVPQECAHSSLGDNGEACSAGSGWLRQFSSARHRAFTGTGVSSPRGMEVPRIVFGRRWVVTTAAAVGVAAGGAVALSAAPGAPSSQGASARIALAQHQQVVAAEAKRLAAEAKRLAAEAATLRQRAAAAPTAAPAVHTTTGASGSSSDDSGGGGGGDS